MIRPSTIADVAELAETMREEDKREIAQMSGLDPLAVLMLGFLHSDECLSACTPSGELVAMLGVVPLVPNLIGSVWLLSAPLLASHKKELLREGRPVLDHLLRRYRLAHNVVAADNHVHQRLIKHMGFRFMEPIENYGVGQIRVIPFERSM